MSLYITFVDLTKAFDTVTREGLYLALAMIGYPSRLLSLVRSFHNSVRGIVQIDGNISGSFGI